MRQVRQLIEDEPHGLERVGAGHGADAGGALRGPGISGGRTVGSSGTQPSLVFGADRSDASGWLEGDGLVGRYELDGRPCSPPSRSCCRLPFLGGSVADPMYRQIADDLRRQIEAGELLPGAQLRTELELREKYDASRNTVRDAIKWLITRGLVETRPGQGTFVFERIDPFLTTLTGDPEDRVRRRWRVQRDIETAGKAQDARGRPPRVEIQEASERMAANELISGPAHRWSAGISALSSTARRGPCKPRFIRWTWSKGRSPAHPGGRHQRGDGGIPAEEPGHPAGGLPGHDHGPRPGHETRPFFSLPEDGRISVIEASPDRLRPDGTPVRLTVSVYPADRNQFSFVVGQVPARGPDAAPAGHEDTAS